MSDPAVDNILSFLSAIILGAGVLAALIPLCFVVAHVLDRLFSDR